MIEYVAPPDSDKEITGHLAEQLAALGDSSAVVTKIIASTPARVVRVIRAGGSKTNLIVDAPLVILECCDNDEVAAADLARKVRAIMFASAPGRVGDVWCNAIHEAGVVFQPDPETLKPRYVITAEWHLVCSVL